MTDEDLQKLVAELRHPIQRNERYYEPLCARAADEIERLEDRLAALTQSDAELRVTLDEIEAAMDRVLERRGLKAQVDNLERRSAW